MDWLVELIRAGSVAQALLVLSLVAVSGLALGNLRVRGVGLGVAGVLFSGLVFGHFGVGIDSEIIEFAREFGLILFVYTIGMQVGPGFLASLRRQGLTLNAMAAAVVLLGGLLTAGLIYSGIEAPVAVGLLSGATTNTPSLAAAQQTLKTMEGIPEAATRLPGIGYAVAYPFGVLGLILVIVVTRVVFRVDPKKEAILLEEAKEAESKRLSTINLEVRNPNLDGLPVQQIPTLSTSGVVISRISRGTGVEVPRPDTTVRLGDILHAVGPPEKLDELRLVVGNVSKVDIKALPSKLITKRIVVTKNKAVRRFIQELDLPEIYGVTVTRVTRAGLEFTATGSFRLQFGDILMAVGEPDAIRRVAEELGDSPEHLDHPHILPIFLGIGLGVILGSFPLYFPGIPASVKLGLAGGPLLTAIILSRVGRMGPLIWYMPVNANLMLREIGITLFLACVGLRAGNGFVQTLTDGHGMYWMSMAAIVTVLPAMVVSLVARAFYKLNFLSLSGLLAGSMTDPPALAFARSLADSEAPSVSYAAVYPLVMLLRVFSAQILLLIFA
ncbi:MAG: putative transporter [Acidobacteria bacterium]|nr:MAG: putative transporter [Acidobacteriota bacterium]